MGYLNITEAATTLTIQSTAAPFFEIVFDEANSGGCIDTLYFGDGGSTNYSDATALLDYFINDGTERLMSGMTCTMTVLEALPTRCRVLFTGDITTNVSLEQYVTIYPSGRIFFETNLTNSTGSSITGTTGGIRLKTDATNYTSDGQYGDNTGDTTPTYNTEYWFAHTSSSSLNSIICCIIDADTEGQQDVYAESANSNEYRKDTVTWLTATSYSHRYMLLLDADYYNATEATQATSIEAQISQYTDLVI